MCLDQKLFDLDGEVNEERLRHEIHQEIRPAARNDTAKKTRVYLRSRLICAKWRK